MRFSVKFLPTALFSLKESNSTNSGAKSLFLPSPYSIKMAILNQAIIGNELDNFKAKNSLQFQFVRDTKISYFLNSDSSFCVNNTFVKILKISEDKRSKKDKEAGKPFKDGFIETISFREYIHVSQPIEIIFETKTEEAAIFLKKYLHKINYFGKKGCFFQFMDYNNSPPEANVSIFNSKTSLYGILQKYDDFDDKATFEMVDNYSEKATKRKEEIWVLPLKQASSSKSYTNYKFF